MKTISSMHPCFIQGSDRARRFMMEESSRQRGLTSQITLGLVRNCLSQWLTCKIFGTTYLDIFSRKNILRCFFKTGPLAEDSGTFHNLHKILAETFLNGLQEWRSCFLLIRYPYNKDVVGLGKFNLGVSKFPQKS